MAKKIDESLNTLRHSTAHVMADAVLRLFPGTKLGMGPSIEDGFYYDFEFQKPVTPEDLPKIEEEMARIVKEDLRFERKTVSLHEARKMFSASGEKYKLEILDELEGQEITLYTHGPFTDLCRGPHIGSTGEIKAFKLLSLAGAYWKGSEDNQMLQRIYGTVFKSREDLDDHLKMREEAQKRDHRKLGKELDLFSFNESVGPGLVLYHPKGARMRQMIADYITARHFERGYQLITSPHVLKSDIWVRSGHYDYYKDNMYIFKIEEQEFAIKPMNCPGHIIVYASKMRSYRELPVRFFELGSVYRHEKSGVLHGLMRVRGFTQDDAHIFCRKDQVIDEINGVMDFVKETLNVFGFAEFEVEISTRPVKSIGTDEDWEQATTALKGALDKQCIPYEINEGDGAFYGPKIDIKLKDAIGRSWQCATIQCDFALPERFDLKYTDSEGKERRPVMLHRVIFGSLERFFGVLVEHYAGDFPVWLAPVQVMMVPIAAAHAEYGEEVKNILTRKGFRVEIDARDEKMQKKIRDAELEKIPYMLVVGKKEMDERTVSVRTRKEGNIGVLSIDNFAERLGNEVVARKQ
jgi:threonyl-tRNA synthetase